jgi:hypothetical protein
MYNGYAINHIYRRNIMIDFTTDWEKMRDYFQISKEEFLASYSYVTEAEYDATKKVVEKKDAFIKIYQTEKY